MRPFHHNSNMGRGGGGGDGRGPLLTEHLRDLDLELELLKRKREMIEKQQTLLNQQQAFNLQSFSFDQPQSFRDEHYDDRSQYNSNRDYSSSSRDFSHLYSEPQQSRDRFPRQSAKKRLGDYVWSDPPIKRPFGGPSNKFGSGSANKFGSGPANKFGSGPSNKFGSGPAKKFGSGPKSSKYVPSADKHTFVKTQPGKPKPSERFKAPQRPVKPKPTDFKPTKVVKPKTALANKAPTNVPKQATAELVPKGDAEATPILQPDQAPSQQVTGRLELALGNILKVVKDKYSNDPQYKRSFLETISSRGMKQEIRDRIRKVMVGKPVGHVVEIIKMYREVYPDSTDIEIVESGMQKKNIKPSKFKVVTDPTLNPYVFFKRNFSSLLSDSLNKMFTKIYAISKEEALRREKLEVENNAAESAEVTAPTEATKTDSNETYDPEAPTEEKVSEEQQGVEDTEKSKEEDITEKSTEEDVTEKPNEEAVTEELKETSLNAEPKVDDATEKAEGDATEEAKDDASEEAKDDATEKTVGDATEKAVGDATEKTVGDATEKAVGDATEKADATVQQEEIKGLVNTAQNARYPVNAVRAQYEQMMDDMMPRKLAAWLPKLKGQIMRALLADYDFKKLRKQIVEETEARLNKEQNRETNTSEAKAPATADTKKPKLKYYVKIQGRPMLPKKQLMKPFLEQFNPKVIKTIKGLRNLLFVGFENKAEFDRIVAANGTIVGTDKIIVKISQWVTSEALNAPAEPTSTPNTSTISDGDVTMKDANSNPTPEKSNDTTDLNSSLDNQIDELLTSIRNEEEAGNSEIKDGDEENANVEEETAEVENGENVASEDAGTDEPMEEAADNENGTEEVQESTENNDQEKIEAKDKVEELKSDAKDTGRATPSRASTRLAASTPNTPSTIRTRRASRLAQN